MIDYSVGKYIIKDNQILTSKTLCDFDRVKEVDIECDFDLSDEIGGHFTKLRDLERFVVLSEDSAFFTEDGVLFANISSDPHGELRQKEMFRYLPESIHGKVLVAFPPACPIRKYVVPDGTKDIASGAFCGADIEELSLPDSIEYIGLEAFSETKSLTVLRVPNKESIVQLNLDNVGTDNNVIVNSNSDSPLDDRVSYMWSLAVGTAGNRLQVDKNLRKCFYEHYYLRPIAWPDDKSRMDILNALKSKEGIISYYLKMMNRGADDALKVAFNPNDAILDALFYYLIEPHHLHPSNKEEADIISKLVFGESGITEPWIGKYAKNDTDYKALCNLLHTDKVRLFDYISSTAIKKILEPKIRN